MNGAGAGARAVSLPAQKNREDSAAGFDALLTGQIPPADAAPTAVKTAAAAATKTGGQPNGARQSGPSVRLDGGMAVMVRSLQAKESSLDGAAPAPEAARPETQPTARPGAAAGLPAGLPSAADAADGAATTYRPPVPQATKMVGPQDADAESASATAPSQDEGTADVAPGATAAGDVPTAQAAQPPQAAPPAVDGSAATAVAATPATAVAPPQHTFMAGGQILTDAGPAEAQTLTGMPEELTNPGQQVTRQVGAHLLRNLAALGGTQGLRLTLNPEQLGRVEITFAREGRNLQLTIRAETADASRALRNGAGELQTVLLERGGDWHQVTVKVEDGKPQDERDDGSHDRRRRDGREEQPEQEGSPS
jgi:flagellar hook-length control protein FliK